VAITVRLVKAVGEEMPTEIVMRPAMVQSLKKDERGRLALLAIELTKSRSLVSLAYRNPSSRCHWLWLRENRKPRTEDILM
jgi:hypothetical protein